jgi:predicted alpha/beta hydrolase family esterase
MVWERSLDTILIVPGLSNSCDRHWQSWFEGCLPGCVRVSQTDWERADLRVWTGAVKNAAEASTGRVWIVAHSFGCLATACAASQTKADIAGALLVAPADPAKFGAAFMLPRTALPFRTVVVGSENDDWMSLGNARRWSRAWGASFVNAGRAGHINVASGHGPWPDGLHLFGAMRNEWSSMAGAGH